MKLKLGNQNCSYDENVRDEKINYIFNAFLAKEIRVGMKPYVVSREGLKDEFYLCSNTEI